MRGSKGAGANPWFTTGFGLVPAAAGQHNGPQGVPGATVPLPVEEPLLSGRQGGQGEEPLLLRGAGGEGHDERVGRTARVPGARGAGPGPGRKYISMHHLRHLH